MNDRRMKNVPAEEGAVSRSLSVLASAVDKLELQAQEGTVAQPAALSNSNNPALQRIATRQGIQP